MTVNRVNRMCSLILQVSLGKCNELLAADFSADKLPTGCHSVKGVGKVAPDPNDTHTMQVFVDDKKWQLKLSLE